MSAQPTAASPLEALKAGFRRACVRRLVGDEDGAIEVLKNEIPLLVVGWAKSTSLEPAEKKAKLKEMFDDESARADELATAFDLFAGRFETRVAELVRKELKRAASGLEKLAKELAEAPKPSQADAKEEQQAEIDLTEPDHVTEEPEEEESFAEEEVEHLDPPKGIGLRFDEIEQMIDEVLSKDS
ncbi:MAG: hypothetical protein VX855_07790 [Verrucomicrobiota bacterium]|nr:hypothetical protein [Verrucomicrobiota bacterium]